MTNSGSCYKMNAWNDHTHVYTDNTNKVNKENEVNSRQQGMWFLLGNEV